jgi:hypothetical protein
MPRVKKLKKAVVRDDLSPAAEQALVRAADMLRHYEDEGAGIPGLVTKIYAIAGRDSDGAHLTKAGTGTARLEEAMTEMAELRKRDDLDPETRTKVDKASRDVQAEYLAQASPAGWAAWKQARERAGFTN